MKREKGGGGGGGEKEKKKKKEIQWGWTDQSKAQSFVDNHMG